MNNNLTERTSHIISQKRVSLLMILKPLTA